MEISYENQLHDISIEKKDNKIIGSINGDKVNYTIRKVTDNVFQFMIDSEKINLFVDDDDEHFYVNVDGENFTFDKIKEEETSFEGEEASSADRDVIKPPMPGSVVKVEVEVDEGVVTLCGTVRSMADADKIREFVRDLPGVKDIVSKMGARW